MKQRRISKTIAMSVISAAIAAGFSACGGDGSSDDSPVVSTGGQTPVPFTGPAWMNTALTPDARALALVSAMTLDQKIQQIAMNPGANPTLAGCGLATGGRHIEGITALSIPTVRMTNGPTGVNGGDCTPDAAATAVPANFVIAASWDPVLANQWGVLTGNETKSNGLTVLLAPGMNMGRISTGGRTFEYMGDDPMLTGTIASSIVKGIQSQGVTATAKHYVANEQETTRQTLNNIIDQRSLQELYLLPFEMAVKDAGLDSVMCSYPKLNGTYSCENPYILSTVLRGQWGFKGFVMSDRGATKSTVPSIKAGLDLEFASPVWFTPANINAALAAGTVTVSDIETMLKRRYYTMFKDGQFDKPINALTPIDFAGHGVMARSMAAAGSVLLKNSGILPLNATSLHSIALIGPKTFAGAAKLPGQAPGGNVFVVTTYTVTPQQGLQNALTAAGSNATVTYNDGTDTAAAVKLAAASDVVIYMGGDLSAEGSDRADLNLPVNSGVDQNALLQALTTAAPGKMVVVLKNGGPVLMPWLDAVNAVLESWYPGQEDGNAVADLLFGKVNPSGKLPITFPAADREAGSSTVAQWPGVSVGGVPTVTYSEGLSMGYRWYDATGRTPLFPFGYGLSYTNFLESDFQVSATSVNSTTPLTVSFNIENSGTVAGAEVPQVYARFASSYAEPKRLVGWSKVQLNTGESRRVSITIDPRATNHPMSYFDVASQSYKPMTGTVTLYLARSSAPTDVLATKVISLTN